LPQALAADVIKQELKRETHRFAWILCVYSTVHPWAVVGRIQALASKLLRGKIKTPMSPRFIDPVTNAMQTQTNP
jgi:hypothetical protein